MSHTMAQILDAELDGLLCEAELRLKTSPTVETKRDKKGSEPTVCQSLTQTKELHIRSVAHSKVSTPVEDTTGDAWFNLPKTHLTSEFKRDWNILRMRNLLDPKHQRKTLRAEPPKYSHVGEIISGPTEYFSARLSKKERKKSLLEEALYERNDAKLTTKYAGIQKQKASGRKAFYQNVLKNRCRGNNG